MSRRWCLSCLNWEEDICEHDWIEIQEGCVCPPECWRDAPTEVCDRFVVDAEMDGLCGACEHELACHLNEAA